MTNTTSITPKGLLNAVVKPPGSKSITNRALILAALAEGKTTLTGALASEDTQMMFEGLAQLGVPLDWNTEQKQITVYGQGGRFPHKRADIYVGNSGTTARFLTAMLAFSSGEYRIHGKPRMHQRPIRNLVEALNTLGGCVTYEADEGFPPVVISPQNRWASAIPHACVIGGEISSQFLTALLLASPLASKKSAVEICVTGDLVSKPYVEMTLWMMQSFGVNVETDEHFRSFRIEQGTIYQSQEVYAIEPDASAASYFLAAAAICGGTVTVQGLSKNSLQGDVAFAECLERMNCEVTWQENSITVSRPPERPLQGITVDMNSISDTAQTLSVVALFAEGATEIRNIEHVRFKETDRIADLATELRRFGATVEEHQDGLRITPPTVLTPATVQTYDDHRMAMSFAIAGLRLPGVVICDPDCTQKTFPEFFETLEKLSPS
ncbi:MAG: 3-phosphoshikimate 1-carboxyvinyltransferase [Planctomycetaceae bacterium]|nr:3-phosphoshikimate 1-carboxyvinyltransferase [Planctomycetaceae bacterium]